jgi:hypothetical protein
MASRDRSTTDSGRKRSIRQHGFTPTTTYELVWEERPDPPKAILGTAYEFATGQRLDSGDFEGGKSGAVRVLGNLGLRSDRDDLRADMVTAQSANRAG